MKVFVMDWVPIAFGTFKVVALLTAMFFAIKWHYDQDKKLKKQARSPDATKEERGAARR